MEVKFSSEDINKKREKSHCHIMFITAYCYNFVLFLVIVINHLLCSIYKLNLVTGMHVQGKNIYIGFGTNICAVSDLIGSHGIYPLRTREIAIQAVSYATD